MEQRLDRLQVKNYLHGVTLDEELSFKEHVEKLCKKLSKKIGL